MADHPSDARTGRAPDESPDRAPGWAALTLPVLGPVAVAAALVAAFQAQDARTFDQGVTAADGQVVRCLDARTPRCAVEYVLTDGDRQTGTVYDAGYAVGEVVPVEYADVESSLVRVTGDADASLLAAMTGAGAALLVGSVVTAAIVDRRRAS